MFHMERSEFLEKIDVSHETAEKLDRYAELLTEWNQKFNLIAKSTLPHIWQRHFLDSAQLAQFIPKTAKTLIDFGSGAGFPGLVLSIMNAAPNIHLVESTGKKANFLRTVIDELHLKASVHQCRIEDLKNMKADIITARAAAPLAELLKLSMSLIKKETLCLFLKGRNADSELTESEKCWKFDCEKIASLSDDSGNVLIIRNQKPKNAATHNRR
jgi:16S rRNA (guanine527-N7)-methyltransferase